VLRYTSEAHDIVTQGITRDEDLASLDVRPQCLLTMHLHASVLHYDSHIRLHSPPVPSPYRS